MGIADKTKNTLDFRELAETCPVALFQVDPQGHCTYANAACVRLLDVADPLGTGWMQAVHPLDQAIAAAMWHRPYETLGVERVLRLGHQDGPVTHVRVRATPLMFPGGGLRGYAVTAVDITPSASKLERLESANAFLARAEEIAGVGCWRFDIRTRELLWTSNMRRIHELPDDYVPRGDEHVKYFDAAPRAQLEEAVRQSLADRRPWDLRLPMRTASGREIWVRSFGEPEAVDGTVVAVVGVLHDITQERRRTEELLAARNAADTLNRAKTELLGMISHRVRTPLNGIVGNTQLMLIDPALPPELRQRMDQVAQSAQALLTVVEEVLGTDGIEIGRVQKKRTAAVPPASPATGDQPKPRVLVVEDNPVNQAVAKALLRKLGCERVDVANDGSEAVHMAAHGGYELILMDCQMPVMDGYEATRQLRAAGCRSQIVAVTASVSKGARERCLAAGMDEYASKPIDLEKLQWILARCAEAGAAPSRRPGPINVLAGGLPPQVEALRTRCIEACEACTTACDSALRSDERYTSPGTDPYSALHLSLVSCSSVCSIVSASLEADLGNAVEMTQWCAEVCGACRDTASAADAATPEREDVLAACEACVAACTGLAAALVPRPAH